VSATSATRRPALSARSRGADHRDTLHFDTD
jgi:hypothetical protein